MKWLLFLIVLGLFSPMFTFKDFHVDDNDHLAQNKEMMEGGFASLKNFWTTPRLNAYTPVTYTVWKLATLPYFHKKNPQTGKLILDARVYRAANVFFYALTCVLVFSWLLKIVGNYLAATLGAFLFALHPLHVEAVGWITGLRDVLSCFFMVACLLSYDALSKASSADLKTVFYFFRSKRLALRYLFFSLLFLLAVLSKPTAFCLPLIIFILALWHYKKNILQVISEFILWIFFLPLLLLQDEQNMLLAQRAADYTGWKSKLIIALDTFGFYVSKIFFPIGLSLDYGRTPTVVLSSYFFLIVELFVLLTLVVLWTYRKKNWTKVFCVCLGILFISLIPVLGFNKFIFQHISSVSDRYVHFGVIAPCLFVAWAISKSVNKKILMPVFTFVLLALSIQTFKQVWVWESKFSLYNRMVQINSKSWLGHNQLGLWYEDKGDLEKSVQSFKLAAKYNDFGPIWQNLGLVLLKQGKVQEAVTAFQRAKSSS